MEDLGNRLQKARSEFNYSQDYVAKKLGISRSAVSQIERGKRKVSSSELNLLSKIFGISTDELLKRHQVDIPSQVFVKKFEELDENDQNEILNLIEFKRVMKVKRGREWSDYMELAARHSKGNARHWFRYLRKEINKCGVTFSKDDVFSLYRNEVLTPFQRVSIKAAFEDGSPTRQHILSLNKTAKRNNVLLVRDKYENCEMVNELPNLEEKVDNINYLVGMKLMSGREQDLMDVGDILKKDRNEKPFELLSKLSGMKFVIDISELLDAYEKAHGLDWLDEFYVNNQEELRKYF